MVAKYPKTDYPFSTWYKKEALQSLEIAHAINFVVFIGYWIYVFPNTQQMYK